MRRLVGERDPKACYDQRNREQRANRAHMRERNQTPPSTLVAAIIGVHRLAHQHPSPQRLARHGATVFDGLSAFMLSPV
jgi:hypothetical protein